MTPQGFLEVHIPSGTPERHELLATRSLVGAGPEATVRVSPGSRFAAVELELEIQPNGVLVRTPGASASIVFQGTSFSIATVPWGDEIFVKGVRLTFLAATAKHSRPNPVLLIIAPLALLLVGVAAFQSLGTDDTLAREVEAPSLVDEARPCVQTNPQDAAHQAREAEHAALAKQERFPFDARDGVEAASLLGQARACFATAALEPDRARVESELAQWSERLRQDYAALQLKLRVALDNDRREDALDACLGLEALLGSRPDSPYRQWLQSVRRKSQAVLAGPKG